MGIISRLIGAGDMLLYHDYRSGSFRDFSGNNNHGTPTSGIILGRSGIAVPPSNEVAVTDNDGFNITAITYVIHFKDGFRANDTVHNFLQKGASGNTSFNCFSNTTGTVLSWYDGVSTKTLSTSLLNAKTIIVTLASGEVFNAYIDGLFVGSGSGTNVVVDRDSSDIRPSGAGANSPRVYNKISSSLIFNRVLTPNEVVELHTELISKKWNQKTVCLYQDYQKNYIRSSFSKYADIPTGTYTAGQTVTGTPWYVDNGTFQVASETVNGKTTKTLNCTVGGKAYIDLGNLVETYNDAAYGKWTIWYYKDTDNLTLLMPIAKTTANYNDVGQYGYLISALANERQRFFEDTNGSITQLFSSNIAVHASSAWTKYELYRDIQGKFSFYMDGVLWSTSGGTGTNPYIDNTNQENRYIVWQGNSPDKIALVAEDEEIVLKLEPLKTLSVSGLGNGALETASNVTSGPLPGTPFEVYSGTWKTTYDTINGKPVKVIECVANGVIYSPWSRFQNNEGEAAYGTWECWVNKAAASIMNIDIIAAANNALTAGDYLFEYDASENLALVEQGTGDVISGGTAADSTWHSVKVTRTASGNFELIVNGTSEGTGSDTTTTTAKYVTIDIDAGDKIAIAGFDGTPLFVKRKGVA